VVNVNARRHYSRIQIAKHPALDICSQILIEYRQKRREMLVTKINQPSTAAQEMPRKNRSKSGLNFIVSVSSSKHFRQYHFVENRIALTFQHIPAKL